MFWLFWGWGKYCEKAGLCGLWLGWLPAVRVDLTSSRNDFILVLRLFIGSRTNNRINSIFHLISLINFWVKTGLASSYLLCNYSNFPWSHLFYGSSLCKRKWNPLKALFQVVSKASTFFCSLWNRLHDSVSDSNSSSPAIFSLHLFMSLIFT